MGLLLSLLCIVKIFLTDVLACYMIQRFLLFLCILLLDGRLSLLGIVNIDYRSIKLIDYSGDVMLNDFPSII